MGAFALKCTFSFISSLSIYFGVLLIAMNVGDVSSHQTSNPTEVAKWALAYALFGSFGTTILVSISFLVKRLPGNLSYLYIPFLLVVLTFIFIWTQNLSQPTFGTANLQIASVLFAVFLFCLCVIWAGDKLVKTLLE